MIRQVGGETWATKLSLRGRNATVGKKKKGKSINTLKVHGGQGEVLSFLTKKKKILFRREKLMKKDRTLHAPNQGTVLDFDMTNL